MSQTTAVGGGIAIEVMNQNEKVVYSPTTVVAMILQHLKQLAERHLGSSVCDIVISVPQYWTDRQRRAMLDAGLVSKIVLINP